MVTISAIAAMSKNRVMGKNNQLPWEMPADLKYFKEMTQGKTVIMGRRTYESIGSKPLPKRRNIVMTRDQNFSSDNIEVVHSVEQLLELLKDEKQEVMNVGGAEIYQLLMPYMDKVYLTLIDLECDGDTFFPELEGFVETLSTDHQADDANSHNYSFKVFEKV